MIKGNIVKNFTLDEMANNQANETVKLIITPEVVKFAQMVQELRDFYKKPMQVNSWYRTEFYNKQVGGSKNSLHLDGLAVDIATTDYIKLAERWKIICRKHQRVGGVNLYDTFMHFSIGEEKFGVKGFITRDYRGGK